MPAVEGWLTMFERLFSFVGTTRTPRVGVSGT
jgi:hypothetical protein